MFNANNVLSLLVEALREGGEVRLREFAKTYATDNLGSNFNEEALTEILNEIVEALNNFDKDKALEVLAGAQDRLTSFPEDEDEEDDEDEDETEEDSDRPDLATRVSALEKGLAELRQVAVSRGLL